MGWRQNCVTRLTGSVDGCWKPHDYRADAPRRRAISALKNTIVPMLRVGMPFWTLRVRSCVCGAAQTCDAERHERHSHAGACGTIIPTVVPKFFSHRATLRVRSCVCGAAQTCDAERHERHSHAGACGTIIPTVVPKLFSHRATLPRPVLHLRCGFMTLLFQ